MLNRTATMNTCMSVDLILLNNDVTSVMRDILFYRIKLPVVFLGFN